MNEQQYALISARRQAYDTMMWQTPVLGLTAQSFLFTIGLGPYTTELARSIAALLALVTALCSLQLMAKHRHHELRDRMLLEAFESDASNSYAPLSSKPDNSTAPAFIRLSSFNVWRAALIIFAIASFVILLCSTLRPELLSATPSRQGPETIQRLTKAVEAQDSQLRTMAITVQALSTETKAQMARLTASVPALGSAQQTPAHGPASPSRPSSNPTPHR